MYLERVTSAACEWVYIHIHPLLLLSGDIEENPGPTTHGGSNPADPTIHELLAKLESGQASIISELKAINSRLASAEETLNDLIARIAKTD